MEGGLMRDADTSVPMQAAGLTTPPSRPKHETARLGKEVYERDIRPQVEAHHNGEVVAIDVDSGNWAIGDEAPEAVDRLYVQYPEAHDIWCLRVGTRAVYNFGGSTLRKLR